LTNSKEARAINKTLRDQYKDGILEKIYDRQEKTEQVKQTIEPSTQTIVKSAKEVDSSIDGSDSEYDDIN